MWRAASTIARTVTAASNSSVFHHTAPVMAGSERVPAWVNDAEPAGPNPRSNPVS